jgi:predicted oxidoreductase
MKSSGHQAMPPISINTRSPKRLTITVPHHVYDTLISESDFQGRSVSNLAAFWLELQIEGNRNPIQKRMG